MDVDGRDFLNTPPIKTVRFGGNLVNMLAKYKKVGKYRIKQTCLLAFTLDYSAIK